MPAAVIRPPDHVRRAANLVDHANARRDFELGLPEHDLSTPEVTR
jgi:hypothetical protein